MMVECQYSIGPHIAAVGPALGRQSVLQENSQIPHSHTPINVGAYEVARISRSKMVGICGINVVYTAHCFVYMAIYDLEVKPV